MFPRKFFAALTPITFSSIIIGFFLIVALNANGGFMGSGNLGNGHPRLMKSARLQIVDEQLNIDLFGKEAGVDVHYQIRNQGPAITARFGYPCIIFPSGEIKGQEIKAYQIEMNGRPLSFTFQKGREKLKWLKPEGWEFLGGEEDPVPRLAWYVSALPFKSGETASIRISYRSAYQMGVGFVSDSGDVDAAVFRYLFSPAASWHGPIIRGHVQIRALEADADRLLLYPSGRFQRQGNVFNWNFANLKPTARDNLVINFRNGYGFNETYYAETERKPLKIFEYENKTYLPVEGGQAGASSFLKKGNKAYPPANAIDGSQLTAWVEGKGDEGIGEYLEISFPRPVAVTHLALLNGYRKNRSLYYKNNRISVLRIVTNGGRQKKVTLRDAYIDYGMDNPHTYQFIELGNVNKKIRKVKLIIEKVIRGSQYNDTCLGEVRFFQTMKGPMPRSR